MLAVLALCLSIANPAPQQEQPTLRLQQDQVAVWNGGSISQARFDRFLGANAHYQQTGIEALTHLLQLQLVRLESEARGLKADPTTVEARVAEAQAQIEAAGKDLEVMLRARQMGMAEFRDLMHDSVLHEQLVRADMQIPFQDSITPEQLNQWTDERIAALLELSKTAPPGMMLDAPPYRISEEEVGGIIRQTSGNEDLVDRVEQLVLMEALPQWAAQQKLPLTDDVLYQEIEWRRKRVEENPNYGGRTYEEMLMVKQSTIEAVLQSDELRVAGYMRLYSDILYPDSWFEQLDAESRAAMELEYGATRHIGWILMRAHETKTDELDLTFEEAEQELLRLRERIQDGDDFRAIAKDYSEHPSSGQREGMLGWIHRSEKGVIPDLCEAAFNAPGTGIFGPVRVIGDNPLEPLSGMALILIDGIRPAPSEQEFRALVRRGQHRSLRKQFLQEINLHNHWKRRF